MDLGKAQMKNERIMKAPFDAFIGQKFSNDYIRNKVTQEGTVKAKGGKSSMVDEILSKVLAKGSRQQQQPKVVLKKEFEQQIKSVKKSTDNKLPDVNLGFGGNLGKSEPHPRKLTPIKVKRDILNRHLQNKDKARLNLMKLYNNCEPIKIPVAKLNLADSKEETMPNVVKPKIKQATANKPLNKLNLRTFNHNATKENKKKLVKLNYKDAKGGCKKAKAKPGHISEENQALKQSKTLPKGKIKLVLKPKKL